MSARCRDSRRARLPSMTVCPNARSPWANWGRTPGNPCAAGCATAAAALADRLSTEERTVALTLALVLAQALAGRREAVANQREGAQPFAQADRAASPSWAWSLAAAALVALVVQAARACP